MSLRLQIIIIVCMVFAILYIAARLRKKKLDYKFGLSWMLICIIITIFAIWPSFLSKVSRALGIYDPVNMLMFFGLILAIVLIFYLTGEVSRQSEQIKRLTQELAILRKDTHDSLENLEKNRTKQNEVMELETDNSERSKMK